MPFETSKNLRHCNSIATKTYSSKRDIHYIDLLDSIFEKHNSSGFLFLLPNGIFIRPTTINTHFTNICTKAGIRLIEKIKTVKKKKVFVIEADVNTHMSKAQEYLNTLDSDLIYGKKDKNKKCLSTSNIDKH